MSKILIIAEKPSVARDIASALGGFQKNCNYLESETAIISNAIGHLVELHVPEAAINGASLPIIPANGFSLRAVEKTKFQFALLKKLMVRTDISGVVNACDAGREGELIFRLIYELAGCRKPMTRLWIQSMQPDTIREAYRNMRPGADYANLANAARCRSEADWLIGINASRAISRQKEQLMAAGRVQTPTLAILVHRLAEIKTFKPQDYFEVDGTFGVQAGTYMGKWQNSDPAAGEPAERITDKDVASKIIQKCTGKIPSSVTDEKKPSSRHSPRLFDLTALQREANVKFGLSAKDTLAAAQALYEKHKALTYPRTDSNSLPEDYVDKAGETIGAFNSPTSIYAGIYAVHAERILSNNWIKPNKKIFDNSKISDHFAIIPTGVMPNGLLENEAQIYDLVVRRFLSVFHPAAQYLETVRKTIVEHELFKSTGRVLKTPGWLAVYVQENGEILEQNDGEEGASKDSTKESSLCVYMPSEPVKPVSMEGKAQKTRPPKYLTEATLLAAMETAGKFVDDEGLAAALKEKGIGTPATRANIIENLLSDKDSKSNPKEPYVVRSKKNLIPTQKGVDLIELLEKNKIDALTSPATTGDWEQKLRMMETGKYTRNNFMTEIGQLTKSIVQAIAAQEVGNRLTCVCPKCKDSLDAGQRTINCMTCGWKLWRVIAQRPLSDLEAEVLLTQGAIGPLAGFVSKAGKQFSASLEMNHELKVNFVFAPR